RLAPRTALEERSMAGHHDPHMISLLRGKLEVTAEEAFYQLEQTGAAPGAKWGDLIAGIFTASGDLAVASTGGVLLFSVVCQPVLRYVMKYWVKEPTVGVKPGDVFMSTDPRFGNIHTPDQNMFIPIFTDAGELALWVMVIVHEGENGSVEPGGMPSAAESPYMEGIRMPPVKVGENFTLRRDVVTWLQNSVRDPMLQIQDMKIRLSGCLKIKERIESIAGEYSWTELIAALRWTLEDTETEVRRRLAAWPDGTVRSMAFADSTLRENVLIKIAIEARKRGDQLELDFRGTSPQFTNRSNNTVLHALKGMLAQEFLTFVWPDLPRNQAVFAPMKVITDYGSALDCTPEAPNAQSMMTFFPAFTALQMVLPKFLHACTTRYTKIIAPWYNMITTFIYGGINQYGETVGNLCADLNGMSGGAREDADGENSIAPIFAAMTDLGEQEILEEETPIVKIVPHRLMTDNAGFGKYRGGTGYQVIATVRRSDAFGFMTTCVGSKFPSTYGLFGGYGAPTYPLCKVKGINAFEKLRELPESEWTAANIMNSRPFEGAKYSTHHMGMQYEVVKQGELYMIVQGAGGGYGDPLEREPEQVMRDVREQTTSEGTAREIFKVAFDSRTLLVDSEQTNSLRSAEREARKRRGRPFDEFAKDWVKATPPQNLPYYGAWENRDIIFLGSPDNAAARGATQGVTMPDPRDVRIAELEDKLRKAGVALQE
ncbi:MAG TPA: hydantoinase B/oxoprolinase family protein, partial [Candidatus Binataceae bacterium]|nr:hydantoinase B/oxoprolinase family protein [Candidatus Binataceae bacterium]